MLLLSGFFASCDLYDTQPAMIPGYIYVDSFSFVTKADGSEGANSSRFYDAWLYANSLSLGNIGFPALIPVQKSGPVTIRVEPGIFKSGQEDQRLAYPFIEGYDQVVNLRPGKIDTIRPVFRYFQNVKFLMIEDFDHPSFKFTYNKYFRDTTGVWDSILFVPDADTTFAKKNAGKLRIKNESTVFQMYTTDTFILTGQNGPVFWEMDYNSNMVIQFGYYYQEPHQSLSSNRPVINLNPTNGWNKVYISLSEELAGRAANTGFIFYIGIQKQAGESATMMLDNIKLLSF